MRSQYRNTGQRLQKGDTGRQVFCPWPTMIVLYAAQCLLGSLALSACSVSAGVLVFTYPSRFDILCTWTSTQMPAPPKARLTTRFAVFRPTPGRVNNSSIESGTFPPYLSIRPRLRAMMFRALVL